MVRATALAVLALAGCSQQQASGSCPYISPQRPLSELAKANSAADWNMKIDDCVARWGTDIARAPGTVSELAAATIGGCVDAINTYVSTQTQEDMKAGYSIEGDYAERVAARKRDARELAAFYVAASKAGNCAKH